MKKKLQYVIQDKIWDEIQSETKSSTRKNLRKRFCWQKIVRKKIVLDVVPDFQCTK